MNLPLGYKYSSVYAGIRKVEKDDLGLIVSDSPASAAAVFTQNRVCAAPVKISRAHLKKSGGAVKAILVNAGNANCATRDGNAVALQCCDALANKLKVDPEQILPASTGVIGVEMDAKPILRSLAQLIRNLSADRFKDVARAMMTTDLAMKTASRKVPLQDGVVRIAGMTKGSGMIHPNMATTLGFIMTDAALSPRQLKQILDVAVNESYNRISVDGDTSTNDTLVLLANGASNVKPGKKERDAVQQGVSEVALELARQIVRDGEGARKLISIHVVGAADDTDALKLVRSIANSPLVKTAVAGADPNWGRILSAAGNAGVDFSPRKVNIDFQGVPVCQAGVATPFDEAALKQKLESPDCEIRFEIKGKGRGEARFWTCDFTEKYIEINASYRT